MRHKRIKIFKMWCLILREKSQTGKYAYILQEKIGIKIIDNARKKQYP